VNGLFIINDPPYGAERIVNARRMAAALLKVSVHQVRVFLMADAASGANAGQKTPEGYYNVERMLRHVVDENSEIPLCGILPGCPGHCRWQSGGWRAARSMDELVAATVAVDKVLVL
jgi:uncharacterized protein involved in oxidation of intracellular sulfur